MDPIKQENPAENIVKYSLSSLVPEVNNLWISEKSEKNLLSFIDAPLPSLGFYYSAQNWNTVILSHHSYFLPRGCALLIRPGETLLLNSLAEKGGTSFFMEINVHPEATSLEHNLGFTPSELSCFSHNFMNKKSPVLDLPHEVATLFDTAHSLCREAIENPGEKISLLKLKNRLRDLWVAVSEGKAVTSNALDSRIDSLLPKLPSGGYSLLIEKAINQMGDNFDEKITLVNLARNANISLSSFKVRFTAETGISPLEYFTRLLIQKAMLLLHGSDKSTVSIARELGYSSAEHFSGIFKNTAGLTPDEFRSWLEEESTL